MTIARRIARLQEANQEQAITAYSAALASLTDDELIDVMRPLATGRHESRTVAEAEAWERFEALGGPEHYRAAIGAASLTDHVTPRQEARAAVVDRRVMPSVKERIGRALRARRAA